MALRPALRRAGARSPPRASSRSPWNTCSPTTTAGTSRTPAPRAPARSRASSCSATERSSAPRSTARRVHLAGGRGDQHVVRVVERAPAGERLAEGGLRERHGAADRLGVGGDAHRQRAVERERLGPAQRLQPELRARAARPPRGRCPPRSRSDGASKRLRRPGSAAREHRAATRPARRPGERRAGRARRRGRRAGWRGRSRRRLSAGTRAPRPSAVDQPAVGGAAGFHHGLGQRRVAVDDARRPRGSRPRARAR